MFKNWTSEFFTTGPLQQCAFYVLPHWGTTLRASPLNECMFSMRGRGRLSGCICDCWRKYEPTTANTVWKKKKTPCIMYVLYSPHGKVLLRLPCSLFQRFLRTTCIHQACQWTPQKWEKSNLGLLWLAQLFNCLFKPSFLRLPCAMACSKHMSGPTKYTFLSWKGEMYFFKGGCKHGAKSFLSSSDSPF